MKATTPGAAPGGRRTHTTVAAFTVGLPLAAAVLFGVRFGAEHLAALRELGHYVSNPVEFVEVVLFCCAVSALAAKVLGNRIERRACRAEVLPPWDGRPVPAAEAPKLLAALKRTPRRLLNTFLGQRVSAVLDFLSQRVAADDLDDHLRTLADNDVAAMEGGFALTRFITWAIPILGFLGTVLGITTAIHGATPEVLEKSLSSVTDGLSYAFDATALAPGADDDRDVPELPGGARRAGRPRRRGPLRGPLPGAPLPAGRRRRRPVRAGRPGERPGADGIDRRAGAAAGGLVGGNGDGAGPPLRGGARPAARTADRGPGKGTGKDAGRSRHAAGRAGGPGRRADRPSDGANGGAGRGGARHRREQQAALVRVAEGVSAQAGALGRLQEGETNLVHLQAVLHQNLAALASASNFEQAVHSLTAAVHLLTARAAAPSGGPALRLGKAA